MYVGMFVQIHSLPIGMSPEDIRRRAREALNKEFYSLTFSDDDIVVDIEESTGED